MRAAVVRDFNEDLPIETVDDPICPDNGVVLEVASCGVCRSDYHGWTGGHPKVQNGSILGHEYCGAVVEAGPRAIRPWRPIDRAVHSGLWQLPCLLAIKIHRFAQRSFLSQGMDPLIQVTSDR
ncbi:MAG: alcohol dehydrogenase catalytic domain-containing protein [Sulfitobacter sp.]